MTKLMNLPQEERRAAMQKMLNETYAALMFYYDEDGTVKVCAVCNNTSQCDILELFQSAACQANLMLERTFEDFS